MSRKDDEKRDGKETMFIKEYTQYRFDHPIVQKIQLPAHASPAGQSEDVAQWRHHAVMYISFTVDAKYASEPSI